MYFTEGKALIWGRLGKSISAKWAKIGCFGLKMLQNTVLLQNTIFL